MLHLCSPSPFAVLLELCHYHHYYFIRRVLWASWIVPEEDWSCFPASVVVLLLFALPPPHPVHGNETRMNVCGAVMWVCNIIHQRTISTYHPTTSLPPFPMPASPRRKVKAPAPPPTGCAWSGDKKASANNLPHHHRLTYRWGWLLPISNGTVNRFHRQPTT